MPLQVILASASPRRQELLKKIFSEFTIEPANVDETLPPDYPLEYGPEYLARKKAEAIAAIHPEALVIGSDTGVFIDGKMLGKPRDREDAADMLRELSGRSHAVITGCALCLEGRIRSFSDTTQVHMYPFSEAEIQSYLDTGEYTAKAGSYAIQGKGYVLIEGISGDYNNMVGLPAAHLVREIQKFLIEG